MVQYLIKIRIHKQAEFVSVAVVGNSCMLTWIARLAIKQIQLTLTSINPFSSTTDLYPIVNVGDFESVPIVARIEWIFYGAARANVMVPGVTYFSVGTNPSNWATFSFISTPPSTPILDAGPWVAANQAGFMSTVDVIK